MLVEVRDTNADTEHYALDQSAALRDAADLTYYEWIAQIERSGSWRHDGVSTLEGWLIMRRGMLRSTAREDVLLASRVHDLPAVFRAFAEGLLSRDKVLAIASFLDPELDELWAVEAQRYSAAHIQRFARYARRIKREEAAEKDKRRELNLYWDWRAEVLRFSGELPGADGALFKKVIERIAGQPQTDLEGEWIPLAERQADALVALASVKLAEDADTMRSTVVVHVEAEELDRDDGVASLDDGPLVSSSVAQRMACCGYLQPSIDAPDGTCVGIGRRSRIIPKPLMWAVRERDRVCVCCGSDFLLPTEGHHMIPWSEGGGTDLHNLVLTCLRCHRYLHERGYRVFWKEDRTVGIRRPDGSVVNNKPTPLHPDIKARFLRM